MKAIRKFKGLLAPKDGAAPLQAANSWGESDEGDTPRASSSLAEGENKAQVAVESTEDHIAKILKEREQFRKATGGRKGGVVVAVTDAEESTEARSSGTLLLGIGTGGIDDFGADQTAPDDVVSDSPTAVDFSIYDCAFKEEVDRIKRSSSRKRGPVGAVYLTRFNERSQSGVHENLGLSDSDTTPRNSVAMFPTQPRSGRFADFVAKTMKDAKAQAQ